MKRSEFAVIFDLGWHIFEDLPERAEDCIFLIEIITVDFVSDDDEFVFHCELQNFLNGFFAENCASWVSWVDHDDGFDSFPGLAELMERSSSSWSNCQPLSSFK